MIPFISRKLRLRSDDTHIDIPIRVFCPVEGKTAWDCHWEITWPDRQRTNAAGGIDAIQSLLLALSMIGAELYCSEEHQSGRLSWGPEWKGYGFPVPRNLRDLLIGDDAKFL
jgi:hypothetical protein